MLENGVSEILDLEDFDNLLMLDPQTKLYNSVDFYQITPIFTENVLLDQTFFLKLKKNYSNHVIFTSYLLVVQKFGVVFD